MEGILFNNFLILLSFICDRDLRLKKKNLLIEICMNRQFGGSAWFIYPGNRYLVVQKPAPLAGTLSEAVPGGGEAKKM